MPANLAELEIASLNDEQLRQLVNLEKSLNTGQTREIYLIAVSRPR